MLLDRLGRALCVLCLPALLLPPGALWAVASERRAVSLSPPPPPRAVLCL